MAMTDKPESRSRYTEDSIAAASYIYEDCRARGQSAEEAFRRASGRLVESKETWCDDGTPTTAHGLLDHVADFVMSVVDQLDEKAPGNERTIEALRLVAGSIGVMKHSVPNFTSSEIASTNNRGDQAGPATGGSSPGDPRPSTDDKTREAALADALQLVLDDWANANMIGDDARADAEQALNMPIAPSHDGEQIANAAMLEGYAESYTRMGTDARVLASDIARDIRYNMIPALRSSLASTAEIDAPSASGEGTLMLLQRARWALEGTDPDVTPLTSEEHARLVADLKAASS